MACSNCGCTQETVGREVRGEYVMFVCAQCGTHIDTMSIDY